MKQRNKHKQLANSQNQKPRETAATLAESILLNDQLIVQVAAKFGEIRKFLESTGLAPTACTYKREKLEKANSEILREAYKWMVGYEAGYIKGYHRARGLVPESHWELYKANNLVGKMESYEQKQLKMAIKLLHTEWKNRPEILRKYAKGNSNKGNNVRKKTESTGS